jgi:hypothetical protein
MRKYVIIDKSEVSLVDFSKTLMTSENTLFYSLDGTKTVIKYEGDEPFFLAGKTEYSHSEIIVILDTDFWRENES